MNGAPSQASWRPLYKLTWLRVPQGSLSIRNWSVATNELLFYSILCELVNFHRLRVSGCFSTLATVIAYIHCFLLCVFICFPTPFPGTGSG